MDQMFILKLFAPIFLIKNARLLNSSRHFHALTREKTKRRMAKGNERDDFFAHVLRDKNTQITPGFLESQSVLFVVAGSETTATFLTAATWYLTTTPRALDRLQKEIRGAFKSSGEINGDSTSSLRYLFGVMEEGLRVFGPVPVPLPRTCPGAMISGEYIPAGTVVHTASIATARDARYWHDPEKFHPERWLSAEHEYHDAAFDQDMKDASHPFSIGPRACLGINLAYMEMRIILAKCKSARVILRLLSNMEIVIWHFDMELTAKDIVWERDTKIHTLWKKPNVTVRFRPVIRD